MLIYLISFLIFLVISQGQSCLGHSGQVVKWWVVLKIPPKIGIIGYAYYDSLMTNGNFINYNQKIDQGATPLIKTIQQINDLNLQHVAWND